ncbi:hypothetical protein AB0N88_04780 [Streptomyces sp. NPDC093516]|uniref:hypothetical protein n=1 Tax=Streptomyces sp. NPDC093516 TaxID=3155304 RepID=UPI0034214B61
MLAIQPDQIATWLAGLPIEALHSIGPRQAQVLREYGVHSVGLLAALPPDTVQRLLGGMAGRTAAGHSPTASSNRAAARVRHTSWR